MCDVTSMLLLLGLTGLGTWAGFKYGRRSPTAPHRAQPSPMSLSTPEWSMPPRATFRPGYLLLGVFCVLYVLSPIDLLPEAVLGPLGLPDDLVAAFGAFKSFRAAFINSSPHGGK